jgi:RimJ/RimL family protein N-acetyltransferase
MKPCKVEILGMSLEEWKYESCVAHCATGKDWATLYDIESSQEGKGHATKVLLAMREYYQGEGLKFGGSIALNQRMRRLYQRCGITEYQ